MLNWRVIGIDPGISGAIAVIDTDGTVEAIDLPTIGEGTKRELDAAWLLRWVIHQCPDLMCCENVWAMPSQPDGHGKRRGMGAASAFRFGLGIGQIRAVMQCSGAPFSLVVPTVWKKFFQLKGSNKEQSRQLALRLYPRAADVLRRKLDHQRAEAILIATYGLERARLHQRKVI